MLSRELLNEAYSQIEAKHNEIVRALTHRGFELESGWYNGHYQKTADGEWERDAYPIPVISVKELCDVEIQFDQITVSTKLKRDAALMYSFNEVMEYKFEAYGVVDYLSDYSGQTVQDLKDNISTSNENEIGFSFAFPFEANGEQIVEFAKLLRRKGFYASSYEKG